MIASSKTAMIPIRLYDTSNHFSFVVALSDLGMEHGRIEYIRGSHLPIDGFDREMPRLFDEMPEVVHERITPLTFRKRRVRGIPFCVAASQPGLRTQGGGLAPRLLRRPRPGAPKGCRHTVRENLVGRKARPEGHGHSRKIRFESGRSGPRDRGADSLLPRHRGSGPWQRVSCDAFQLGRGK